LHIGTSVGNDIPVSTSDAVGYEFGTAWPTDAVAYFSSNMRPADVFGYKFSAAQLTDAAEYESGAAWPTDAVPVLRVPQMLWGTSLALPSPSDAVEHKSIAVRPTHSVG